SLSLRPRTVSDRLANSSPCLPTAVSGPRSSAGDITEAVASAAVQDPWRSHPSYPWPTCQSGPRPMAFWLVVWLFALLDGQARGQRDEGNETPSAGGRRGCALRRRVVTLTCRPFCAESACRSLYLRQQFLYLEGLGDHRR